MDGCADRAATHRRLAGTLMTGDQEKDALARADRIVERRIDRLPGALEVHPMKVDDAVGND